MYWNYTFFENWKNPILEEYHSHVPTYLVEENVRFWGLHSTVILRSVEYKSADMFIAAEARNQVDPPK